MRHSASALIIPILLSLALSAGSAEAGVNWWTPIGPEGGTISAVAIDPVTGTVYAGTGSGVFVSTNGGASWERRSRGLRSGVNRLALATGPVPTVYAAGWNRLYRSTDEGVSWETLANWSGIDVLAVHPDNSSIVYVGTPFDGVLKSSNGGVSWKQVFDEDACGSVFSLALDARSPSTLYAGCTSRGEVSFYKSTNGGATWEAKGSPLPGWGEYVQIVLAPDQPRVLYVTAHTTIEGVSDWFSFKSTDDGETWTRLDVRGSPISVGPSGLLFLGKSRSRDGGASWEELPVAVWPNLWTFDPAAPETVYAGFASTGDFMSSGLYKSTDTGTSWSPVNNGLWATSIQVLAIDPRSTLYALTSGNGLLKKAVGAGWVRADAGLQLYPLFLGGDPALAIDPVKPANLYLGWRNGFARSTDGGASWTTTAQGRCLGINSLAIDPVNPKQLFAAGILGEGSCEAPGRSCSVFRSGDAGVTWRCAAPPVPSVTKVVIDPTQPARIFALNANRGVWVSNDRGGTWSKLKNPRHVDSFVAELAVDPVDSRRLYLASGAGKIYKSTDRGASWMESSEGLPQETIRRIVVDPRRPQIVYAAGLSGVYISGNGGRTWFPLNGGMPADVVWSFVLDPKNSRKLYAGTYFSGVYVHERR